MLKGHTRQALLTGSTCVDFNWRSMVTSLSHGCLQGATVCSLDGDLVLFGGDKAGVMMCTAGVLGDWRWSHCRTAGQPSSPHKHRSFNLLD